MPTLKPLPLLLAALLLAGCRLTQTGSASFASVLISHRTPEEIKQAAVRVFQEDGYKAYATGAGELEFEKDGTHGQNLAYEGVVGTHYGAQSLVRVRAVIVDQGGGSYRLQCHAFVVTGAGDKFFEDEKQLSNLRSGPYQQLLDKVKASLK